MKLEIEKSSILDFTKVQVIQEGVSLQKLPNCGAPTCTGGSVRHSFGSFLSETPFLKNVYFRNYNFILKIHVKTLLLRTHLQSFLLQRIQRFQGSLRLKVSWIFP